MATSSSSSVEVIDLTLDSDTDSVVSGGESGSSGFSGGGASGCGDGASAHDSDAMIAISDSDESVSLSSDDGGGVDDSATGSDSDSLSDLPIDKKSDVFYNGVLGLPVYRWTKRNEHFSVEDLAKIILAKCPPSSLICSQQPCYVQHNAAFLIDLHKLKDPLDIRADENGTWIRKGSPIAFVSIHNNSGSTSVYRRSKMGKYSHHYKISRSYYRHSASPDFFRIITIAYDNHGSLQQFAFVQYGFDRNEHPVSINPHGNSKKSAKSFSRTKPSTIKMIKKSVDENKRPMKILRAIENDQGGVMQANSSCDLPRDRRQVYNIKQASKVKQENLLLPSCSSVLRTDTLACIMQKCKDTCLTSGAFIRSVEAAPEPMCVLCTDQQLKDMERFCTRSRSSVLSIDPTFNLGKFNVTPTTFHNLLVKNKQGKHPIISGPILIHQTKKFEPFHYFASTMVRLNPNLIGLRSFGTDGEPQLIKAFQTVFTGAVHLRCVNHLRQNVKDKLHALSLPQSSWKDFLGDIFGQQIGTQYEKGLVDSTSPDIFRAALLGLKNRWNNLELSYLPKTSTPQFYTWFCAYKADIIMNTVLPGIRGKAGWSSSDPREKFTTNSSEALNHVIKQEVQWKESKLPMLIEHLKAIVDQQESELEKAVVCRGEWRFTAEYKCLEVNEMAWFTMKADPKQKHMSKVKSFEVANQGDTSSMGVTMENPSLSVPFETVQKLLATISSDTLQCIWTKAKTLLATSGNVLKIPWSDDPRSRLVKSSSSTHPHVVNADHGDMYFCDEHCLMYKGYRVCSHVIAAAEDNGHLAVFLKGSCSKSKPNLAVIANEGLPAGAGRKGGCQKRKRKSAPPIESVSLRPCLQSQGVTSDTSSSSNASRQAPPCKYSCTEEMVEELNTSSPMVVVSSAPPISVAVSLPKSSNVSSSGQVVVGSGMNFNISTVPTVPVPMVASGFNTPSTCVPQTSSCTNPFTLKLKTNSIKICQACRQGYDGIHATLGLVVARSERKLIFNMVNQTQFLGRESNSHYHCLLRCLKTVSPQFKGSDLVIPDAVRAVLTPFQKVCLINFYSRS